MAEEIVWRLVVDDQGQVKKMEEIGKAGKKADEAFDKTKNKSKGLRGELKSLAGSFGGLHSVIGLASTALGAFGVGFGIETILSTTSSLVDETEKFHAVTGMGAQASLSYTAALKARGVGSEAVTRGYKALGKAVESAERQQYQYAVGQEKSSAKGRLYTGLLGTQATAFQKLGINLKALREASPEKQFQMVTEKLEGMKGGLEKANLAQNLFGRGGTQLLPVLEKGPLSLNHFREMAERFFPTLKGEGVKTLEQFREKQAEAKMATEGLEFTLGMKLAPALARGMSSLSGMIVEAKHGKGIFGTLKSIFEGLAGAASGAFGFIKGIAGDLGVKLSGNTLGGVLAAAAAVKGISIAKKPVKDTYKAGKDIYKGIKGIGKYALANPELLPFVAVAAGGAYGGLKLSEAVPHGIMGDPGEQLLKGLKSVLGGLPPGLATSKAPKAEGRAKGSGGTIPSYVEPLTGQRLGPGAVRPTHANELHQALIDLGNLILRLHHQGQSAHQIVGELHMDSTKVGEVIALNPKAMRFLAEGVERHGNFWGAR